MQKKRIEPIVAVKGHGVFDETIGTPFAPVIADIERMTQEKRIEPIVAVEDHDGGVSGVAMGSTPFAVMSEWRQGIPQKKKGVFLIYSRRRHPFKPKTK